MPHVIRASGTGTGVQYAIVPLTKGRYIFHSITAVLGSDVACRGSIKIRLEKGGEDYEYHNLGGGYVARGLPMACPIPFEFEVTAGADIYSSIYHQETTHQHSLNLVFDKERIG